MYIPAAFAVADPNTLHAFFEQHSFGLLVSQVDGEPFASHLPFLLERDSGANGALIGHMARANPHWQHAGGQSVLAIFPGPHAYISPTWYEADNVVPTWNYAAVHAYGRIQIVDDAAGVLRIVQAMVGAYEQSMPQPWSFAGDSAYAERMLSQIVGFRIEIDRIEGKAKLSQNQPVERRRKVIRALRGQRDQTSPDVATLMEAALPGKDECGGTT